MTGEVVLVARSIGRRSATEPLSDEGHAGLVFAAGEDAWIAQAGPSSEGRLAGAFASCEGRPWREAFAVAGGAVWDTGETLTLPVSVLWSTVGDWDPARLASIAAALNARRLIYRYEEGPNSNSFVRLFLEALGVDPPPLPADALRLRGWSWQEA